MRRAAASAALCALAACSSLPPAPIPAAVAPPKEPWQVLFDGNSLDGWSISNFGGPDAVRLADGGMVLDFGAPLTGVTYAGALPKVPYELELTAARLDGDDFFCGLTFPVDDAHLTLVLGGWGGAVTGLSCVDGRDASDNATTSYRTYSRGQRYAVRLEVGPDRVRAWVDGAEIVDQPRAGHRFELRPEVDASKPLGIAAFSTQAWIGPVRWRRLEPR